ncbi:Uncharacterized protein APZ42_023348 [Daphnia magna]|uniref:Uncharacterized protein n=1 Tax=Daphnia magna TaxID=35525 RepID=A0A164V160_9CRUS|nr:Uncharacterized protein APZ42_023348 [Daphnia magna]
MWSIGTGMLDFCLTRFQINDCPALVPLFN